MAKVGVPKIGVKGLFSGWMLVLTLGLLLTAIAILDHGGAVTFSTSSTADGSTGCQLTVTAAELNVRAAPAQDAVLVTTLSQGSVVDGTAIVNNAYRQLEDGNWAASQFLTPTPGSTCG